MISCCEAEVMLLDRRYVPRISSISVRQEVRTKDAWKCDHNENKVLHITCWCKVFANTRSLVRTSCLTDIDEIHGTYTKDLVNIC
jgi:hypothetical protein